MATVMKPLSAPDSHHLRAAQGWLELGNPLEANQELERITPQLRAHPDVMGVRCRICVRRKNWTACVDITETINSSTRTDRMGGFTAHLLCMN